MRNYTIVILNHFPELARNLIESIRKTHKEFPKILVICDRHVTHFGGDVFHLFSAGDFVYATNANKGILSIVAQEDDIVLLNDDCECVEEEFFPKLAAIADKYENCGIMSPLIDGGVGNQFQQYPPLTVWRTKITSPEVITDLTVCFPCVWINRDLINKIGGLDETFTGYGFDDDDYCIRTREAGFRTMITSSIRIKHGAGGNQLMRGSNWSVSFARVSDPKSNMEVFLKKYPHLKIR